MCLEEIVATLPSSAIDRIETSASTIATDFRESDGTLQWNSTRPVLVCGHGGVEHRTGYISADTATATPVDIALWDLAFEGRLLNLPLAALFGTVRKSAPIFDNGGFTSYFDIEPQPQLEQEIPRVKTKNRSLVNAEPLFFTARDAK